jgi:transcriptional regulator with XRE-family HTH domain
MKNVNKQYFLTLMEGRNMSLRGLAEKLGLGHSQLSLTLSGARRMSLDEAAQLSQIFGVPMQEIASAAGVKVRPASGKRVSVVGFVGKDGLVTMHPKEVIERTDAPAELPDSSVAIQFRTSDTPLSWMDTWLVFFCPEQVDPHNAFGRFSVCKVKDGPLVVATPKRGYRDGTFNLAGPFSKENVFLDWVSPLLVSRF